MQLTQAQNDWLSNNQMYDLCGPPRANVKFKDCGTLYADGSFDLMTPMKAVRLEPGCLLIGIPIDPVSDKGKAMTTREESLMLADRLERLQPDRMTGEKGTTFLYSEDIKAMVAALRDAPQIGSENNTNPIAWRSRQKGSHSWSVHTSDPTNAISKYAIAGLAGHDIEPLFTHPNTGPQPGEAAIIGWMYEYTTIYDQWLRGVVLKDRLETNPPTKHNGCPIRNVQPLYATPSPQRAGEPVETKRVYVKRWRTLVELPSKYADEIVEALRPAEPVAVREVVSFPRWWVERIRDGLAGMQLPSGPLGDWAFLFREQLTDALNKSLATKPPAQDDGMRRAIIEECATDIEIQYPGFQNIAEYLRDKYIKSLGSEYHGALASEPGGR